jgi:hypothetical protein
MAVGIERIRRVMNELDLEEDDNRRADLIDEGIGLADEYGGQVAEEWGSYR